MKKHPIEIFSDWVINGKDDGMEKNHLESVKNMLEFVLKDLKDFTFIDAGCGTGWVVRMVSQIEYCLNSSGIDGSSNMIEKAQRLDSVNKYDCADLLTWKPSSKKDIVHSMEVLYYFENPSIVLKNFYNNWLNKDGRLIIGIDFYKENHSCHGWPEKTNVSIMNLLSTAQWVEMFEECGYKNIKNWSVGKSKDWGGTLVITGTKN
jgi:trans-aconitate methyltransferase|tara:strand:- start:718 stop:1332 length:615 start_codon:yes stop_codon:yes gene_type:complete